jgi:hypothetical protein
MEGAMSCDPDPLHAAIDDAKLDEGRTIEFGITCDADYWVKLRDMFEGVEEKEFVVGVAEGCTLADAIRGAVEKERSAEQ